MQALGVTKWRQELADALSVAEEALGIKRGETPAESPESTSAAGEQLPLILMQVVRRQ